MVTVLETYEPEKQKKLALALSERQKYSPNTAIAEKIGVTSMTIGNWFKEFDEKVKVLQKKLKASAEGKGGL
jgi:hypothetical protein